MSRSDGKAPDAKEPIKPAQDTAPMETATAEQTAPEPTTPPRPVEEGKLVYLKLSEVHPFHTVRPHPFKVRDDAKMQEIVASIRVNGVMVPGLARPEKDGNGYPKGTDAPALYSWRYAGKFSARAGTPDR